MVGRDNLGHSVVILALMGLGMVLDLRQWYVPHFPIVAATEVNAQECDPSINVSIIFSALSYNFKILLCLNSLKRLLTLTVL